MGKTMMGSTTHEGNVDLLSSDQQGYLSSAMGGLGQLGQQQDPQQFQQMFQKSFIDPAQQAMQRQTIPGIKEQFLGDESGSSALNQALGQSATDLSTALGQQYMQQYNLGQQRQGGALSNLGQLAGQRTFEPMLQQHQGLAGPLIGALGQLGGAALMGPAGGMLSGLLGGGSSKLQPGYMQNPQAGVRWGG